MRRLFRYGLLAALLSGGLLIAAFLARVRLAQYALESMLGDTGLVEARATVDSVTPQVVALSDVVLIGEEWRLELAALHFVYDLWSRKILKIRVDDGDLFVDVADIMESPSDISMDELADFMEGVQSAMPEMEFSAGSIRVDAVYAERHLELMVDGAGRVSSDQRLTLSLNVSGGGVSLQVALQSNPRDGAVRITGSGRVGDLACLIDSILPAPSAPGGAYDLDATEVGGGFDLELRRLRPVNFHADLHAVGLAGSSQGDTIGMDILGSSLIWTPVGGGLFEIFTEGLSLVSGDWHFGIPEARVHGKIGESIVLPLRLAHVRSGNISASVDLEATVPWPESLKRLPPEMQIEGTISRLVTYGQGWGVVDFDLTLAPESVRFRTPRLMASGRNWPVLKNLEVTIPIAAGAPATLQWLATLDTQADPVGTVSVRSGVALAVSGEVSGLGTQMIRSALRVESPGGRMPLQVGRFGYLDAEGVFDANLELGEDGRLSIASVLELEAIDLSLGPIKARIDRLSAECLLPPTPVTELVQLSESGWIERGRFLSDLDMKVEVVGERLALPGEVVLEWFDFTHLQGSWRKDRAGDPDHRMSLVSASLRAGGDSLTNVEITREMTLGESEIHSTGRMRGHFEGVLVRGRYDDRVLFGENGRPVDFRGHFEFEPFAIRHSDVIARHLSEMAGLSVSAQILVNTDARWTFDRSWNLSFGLAVTDGVLTYPPMNMRTEGIEGAVEIASLNTMSIRGPTVWTMERMTLSDLVIRNGRVALGYAGGDRLDVADLSFEAFGGRFQLDPFSYSLREKSADLRLEVAGLDVGRMLEELNFFEGGFEGSVDGSIPVSIRQGHLFPGYGQLALTPGVTAIFRYGAEGLFTGGEVAKTMTDRLRLLPLQLAEKGLGNIEVESLTVELFDPETPLTPARIHMEGKAVADETKIPYVIDTNINGTVAEFLNFLFRLSSL